VADVEQFSVVEYLLRIGPSSGRLPVGFDPLVELANLGTSAAIVVDFVAVDRFASGSPGGASRTQIQRAPIHPCPEFSIHESSEVALVSKDRSEFCRAHSHPGRTDRHVCSIWSHRS